MTLNDTGKKIRRAIIKYLKEIKEHRKVEEILLIDNTALQYQLWVAMLDQATDAMADDTNLALKLHATAQKFYVNYTNNLKTLGISAIQRKKLNPQQEDEEDNEILNILEDLKHAKV